MFRHWRRLCPADISSYSLRHDVRARPNYLLIDHLRLLSTSSSQPPDSESGSSASSAWSNLRKFFRPEKNEENSKKRRKSKKAKVVDIEPAVASANTDDGDRLPNWLEKAEDEFPPDTASDRRRLTFEASRRIIRIAADRVLEPSAVALLTMSASAVLGIGIAEASLLTTEMPFLESMDAGRFVGRYALEQLLPSCIWATQDAKLVATAMGLDPAQLLQQFGPTVSEADASTLLRIQLLASCRCMAAGFMLLAQLVRAGTIGAAAAGAYEDRVKAGREPPLLLTTGPAKDQRRGLIIRLCGRDSNVTATSLRKMGRHLFPVFEEPDRVYHLVAQHSDGGRVPVFWCVRPGRYGASYSWQGFPIHERYLLRTSTGRKVLLLEADATNGDDPLALEDHALDLTMDDASQGFRRVTELFRSSKGDDAVPLPPFRTLRVFLGNSLETAMSGGGHEYTLRHRVRYAREVDVLIDSRAPVLKEILRWCDGVAGKDRVVLFQTSNRQYFLSLQLILHRYGYRIRDPLDWKLVDQLSDENQDTEAENGSTETADQNDAAYKEYESLLQILMEDRIMENIVPNADANENVEDDKVRLKQAKSDRKRRIMKLSRLPRLVYYGKTAETVNAVEALLNAGAVDVTNCCALLDKEEGTRFLKMILNEKTDMIQRGPMEWRGKNAPLGDGEQDEQLSAPTHGLHIISSSTIYDELFRQVRQWTRMGYSAADIQKELDMRYQEILKQSQEVYETVVEVTTEEEATDAAKAAVKEQPSEEAEGSTLTDESLEIEKKT